MGRIARKKIGMEEGATYGPGELDIGRHVLADGTPRPSVSACFFRKVRKPPKKAGEVSCLDTRPRWIRAAEESEDGVGSC